MRTGLISVFLYTRAIKLPLVPLLIHYFGLAYSLTLCGYLILFSFPAGLMLERLVGNSNSKPKFPLKIGVISTASRCRERGK